MIVRCRGMDLQVPVPLESFDLVMGDGAIIRVRRHGRPDGVGLFVSNGTGHLLQIQKPEECRRAMLQFLDGHGIRY